jgi:hypothetical protein
MTRRNQYAILLAIGATAMTYFLWTEVLSTEAKVAKLVKRSLTDPESAKFRNINKGSDPGLVCGEVNSKNRLGGYVGFTKFLVAADGTVTIDPQSPTGSETPSELILRTAQKVDFLLAYGKKCPKE